MKPKNKTHFFKKFLAFSCTKKDIIWKSCIFVACFCIVMIPCLVLYYKFCHLPEDWGMVEAEKNFDIWITYHFAPDDRFFANLLFLKLGSNWRFIYFTILIIGISIFIPFSFIFVKDKILFSSINWVVFCFWGQSYVGLVDSRGVLDYWYLTGGFEINWIDLCLTIWLCSLPLVVCHSIGWHYEKLKFHFLTSEYFFNKRAQVIYSDRKDIVGFCIKQEKEKKK